MPGLQLYPVNKLLNIMSYVINLNDHQNIVIENFRITFFSYGVGPFLPINRNKHYVLKLNKKGITTCNIEMLYEYLKNNETAARALFNAVSYSNDINTVKNVTRSQFYNSFNDNIPAFIEFFKNSTSGTRQMIIYDHIVFDHDAKMNGIISLSTYVGNNTFCLARCKNCDNAICKYCYANSLTKQRYFLKMKLVRIMSIFTSVELSKGDIPVIDNTIYPYFRFESFGDLNNTLQFQNYNLFALVNSGVNFTIWTKNPGIIQACINNGLQLANNLIIGLSSLYLNTPEIDKAQKYSFIRFLFTVYDNEYIEKHNIIINCGAKHCLSCGICYKYLHEYKNGGLMIINERKK